MADTLITSSVIIVILCILRPILRGKIRPSVSYALWGIAAARLVYPCFNPVIDWLGGFRSPFSIMNAAVPLTGYLATGTPPVQTFPPAPAGNSPVNGTGMSGALPFMNAARSAGIDWTLIFYSIWAVGSVLLLLWLLFAHIRLGKRLIRTRKAYEGTLPEVTEIPVYWAGNIPSPCYFVYFGKKGIYLPESLKDNPEMMRHALVHEFCHAKHRDHIWGMLRCVLLCCYWINPFVWAAGYFSKLDCEIACDEAAVRRLGENERFSYGKTLVTLASVRQPWNVLSTASDIGHGKKTIKERITILIRNPKTAPLTAVFVVCAMILLVLSTFTGKVERLQKSGDVAAIEPASKEQDDSVTVEDIAALADLPKDETLWEAIRQILPAEPPLPPITDSEEYNLNTVISYPFLYEGEGYELQLSGMKEDGSLDYIALQRMNTGEWLNIYRTSEDIEAYDMTLADGAAVRLFLNTHKSMDDYVSYQLPGDLRDGTYMANMGNGGNLFLSEDETQMQRLKELFQYVDEEVSPVEWRAAGGIVRWDYGLYKKIENGMLLATEFPWNHSFYWAETEVITDCEVPALLEPISHELYTPSSLEDAEEKYGPIPEEEQVSHMWYVFFARPDSDVVYAVFLNADLYEKEDVLKLARSVHFKEDAFIP